MRPLRLRWLSSRGQTDRSVSPEPAPINLFARPAPPASAEAPPEPARPLPAASLSAASFTVADARPLRRLVVLDPLHLIDGRLHLHLGDGLVCPLRHGDPAGLNAGWSASALYVGCSSMLWLSLAHRDGFTADWFLTDAATYLCDSVKALPPPLRDSLVRHVQEVLATPPGVAREHALQAYGHMHLETRQYVELYLDAEDHRLKDADLTTGAPLQGLAPCAGPLAAAGRAGAAEFGQPGLFGGAWRHQDGRLALLAGERASVTFPLPYRPAHARLSLDLTGTAVPRLLTVSVGGWTVGSTRIGPEKAMGSRLDYWIPAEALEAGSVTIELTSSPRPAEPAAVLTLHQVALDVGPAMPAVDAAADPAALMALFESLGEDCEFGFVQRHFGIEPLGLFRFAGAKHLRNILRLLETDFAGLGEAGTLSARLINAILYRMPEPPLVIPEFQMVDEALDFAYHTFRGPEQETEAQALAANEQKLRYLKRKFIEDLEDAEKIWVLKDGSRGDVNEAFAFLDVLRRKGPNRLFWVTRTVEGRPSGSVEWIGPDLLRGYSGGPHHDAQIFEAQTWLRLCRNAERAFAERAAPRPA